MHGDHIEPDVSTKNKDKDKDFNYTCITLACIGKQL